MPSRGKADAGDTDASSSQQHPMVTKAMCEHQTALEAMVKVGEVEPQAPALSKGSRER